MCDPAPAACDLDKYYYVHGTVVLVLQSKDRDAILANRQRLAEDISKAEASEERATSKKRL